MKAVLICALLVQQTIAQYGSAPKKTSKPGVPDYPATVNEVVPGSIPNYGVPQQPQGGSNQPGGYPHTPTSPQQPNFPPQPSNPPPAQPGYQPNPSAPQPGFQNPSSQPQPGFQPGPPPSPSPQPGYPTPAQPGFPSKPSFPNQPGFPAQPQPSNPQQPTQGNPSYPNQQPGGSGNNYWWSGPNSPFKPGSEVPAVNPQPPKPPQQSPPSGCGGPGGCGSSSPSNPPNGCGGSPAGGCGSPQPGAPVNIANNPFLSSAIYGKPGQAPTGNPAVPQNPPPAQPAPPGAYPIPAGNNNVPSNYQNNPFLASALQRPIPNTALPTCNTPGAYCVPQHLCNNGLITDGTQAPQSIYKTGQCNPNEVCCKAPKKPFGGTPAPSYVTEAPIQKYTGPLNTTPYPGCAAALKCVSVEYCTVEGVMSDTPVALTREQAENRVPLSDCQNMETGIIGKCCRDPNYKDPWPAGMMMPMNNFDDGQYHPEGHVQPTPGFSAQPPPQIPGRPPVDYNLPKQPNNPNFQQPQQPGVPSPQQPSNPQYPQTNQPPFNPPYQQPGQQPLPSNPQYQQSGQQPKPYNPPTQQPPAAQPFNPPQPSPSFPQQPYFPQPQQPSPPSPNPYQPPAATQSPVNGHTIKKPLGVFNQNVTPFPVAPKPGQTHSQVFPQNEDKVYGKQPSYNNPQNQPSQPNQPNWQLEQQSPQNPPPQAGSGVQPGRNPFPPPYPGQAPSQPSQPQPGQECGIRRPSTASNPVETSFGEFPWHVMIMSSNNRTALCSGVIISPTAVMTAAHCVKGIPSNSLAIVAGVHTLGQPGSKPEQNRVIGAKAIHPAYDSGSLVKDQAILVTEEPLIFDEHVDKICLPPSGMQAYPQNGRVCYITGWGRPSLQTNTPGTPVHKIQVNILPKEQCENNLKQTHLGKYFILNEGFTCAVPPSESDLCKIDIGSPLSCDRGDGHYELGGIYSWDTKCSNNLPGIMATSDTQWIQQVLATPINVLKEQENQPTVETVPDDIDQKPGFALGYGK